MKYIFMAFLLVGCSEYSGTNLTNEEIISAKKVCDSAGMDYAVLSANGNLFYPRKVVCVHKK